MGRGLLMVIQSLEPNETLSQEIKGRLRTLCGNL